MQGFKSPTPPPCCVVPLFSERTDGLCGWRASRCSHSPGSQILRRNPVLVFKFCLQIHNTIWLLNVSGPMKLGFPHCQSNVLTHRGSDRRHDSHWTGHPQQLPLHNLESSWKTGFAQWPIRPHKIFLKLLIPFKI